MDLFMEVFEVVSLASHSTQQRDHRKLSDRMQITLFQCHLESPLRTADVSISFRVTASGTSLLNNRRLRVPKGLQTCF